jgi:SAM-dependent methyltransferase
MTGVEKAFDAYALNYDDHFTETHTGRLQRERVWAYLNRFSAKEYPKVLELNCGTGEDASWLNKRGFSVTATDASAEMIEQSRAKAKKNGQEIRFEQLDLRDWNSQIAEIKFDFIFSDFGGLNCLSPNEIQHLSTELKKRLLPKGKMVLVIMSRNCRWERFWFKRKGKKTEMNRRRSKEAVVATIGQNQFPIWYYSPKEIAQLLSNEFECTNTKPIGLFLPPSYLDNWFRNRKFLVSVLNFFEKIGAFSFLADQADHFLIELAHTKN